MAKCTSCLQETPLDEYLLLDHTCAACYEIWQLSGWPEIQSGSGVGTFNLWKEQENGSKETFGIQIGAVVNREA